MYSDLSDIEALLRKLLEGHIPPLRISKDSDKVLEFSGTFPVMQGKQKVDGHYFASVMPKPKDVRLYFFPIYTHSSSFSPSPALGKMLKGKSCFHLKNFDQDVASEIADMIDLGVQLYRKDELI